MAKYRKKPVVVEATQWWKNGDHPEDGSVWMSRDGEGTEGKVVRRYRRPDDPGTRQCERCSKPMHIHGWIDTLEGGHIVCPGDFIITGVKGERYPCKPDIFAATYEEAVSAPSSSWAVPIEWQATGLLDDRDAEVASARTESAWQEIAGEAVDSLIWCSGSDDFQEGGKAAAGWDRGPKRVIDRYNALSRSFRAASILANDLFESIRHGDEKHQGWLRQKLAEFAKATLAPNLRNFANGQPLVPVGRRAI